MFYGATPEIFENARILRNNQTPAEKKLWQYLSNNQLGVKFRRQHPIASYIVDFYCHELKLVIEVDGEYHNDAEQILLDEDRTNEIEQFGLLVIRFVNNEVLKDIKSVIDRINQVIETITEGRVPPLGG